MTENLLELKQQQLELNEKLAILEKEIYNQNILKTAKFAIGAKVKTYIPEGNFQNTITGVKTTRPRHDFYAFVKSYHIDKDGTVRAIEYTGCDSNGRNTNKYVFVFTEYSELVEE